MSPKTRRISAYVLVGTASFLLFVATFAIWVNRQALNSENWASTSSELLADEDIRDAVETYLVDQIYLTVDVKDRLEAQLPKNLKPLAAPAALGLQQLTDETAKKVLGSQKFQSLWRKANLFAHNALIKVLDGDAKIVHLNNGAITLDLHELAVALATQAGIDDSTIAKLPAEIGELEVIRADELSTAQSIYKLVKPLTILLSALTLLFYAGAIAIAPPGTRRKLFFICGAAIAVVGTLVLIGRRLGAQIVVEQLAKTEAAKDPTNAVWYISSSLLAEIARSVLLYGLAFMAAAWIAGPAMYALWLRERVAPVLQMRTSYVYGGLAVLILALLLWGPLPSTRQLIPGLVLVALIVVGVELLKRQVRREFPVGSSSMLNKG